MVSNVDQISADNSPQIFYDFMLNSEVPCKSILVPNLSRWTGH